MYAILVILLTLEWLYVGTYPVHLHRSVVSCALSFAVLLHSLHAKITTISWIMIYVKSWKFSNYLGSYALTISRGLIQGGARGVFIPPTSEQKKLNVIEFFLLYYYVVKGWKSFSPPKILARAALEYAGISTWKWGQYIFLFWSKDSSVSHTVYNVYYQGEL